MVWEYPTNFSGGQTINTTGSILAYGSYVTGGMMGYGLLVVIFLMVFLGGTITNFRKSGMAAGFVTTIFSVYFMRIGMVSTVVPWFLIIITAILAAIGSKEGSSAL